MRLIDADALKMAFRTRECAEEFGHSIYRLFFVDDVIDAQPSVDAVPVVRCEDCKFLHDKGYCTLVAGLTSIKPDDYCSYGAKMEVE